MTNQQQVATRSIGERVYPVSEIFKSFQGEGPQIGQLCIFLRFAGCDYDCAWCDTRYAVRPGYEGWHKDDLTADQIIERLDRIQPRPKWLILTGGNPALFVDKPFLHALSDAGFDIAMENQGTHLSADWVADAALNYLVINPKPPSAMNKVEIDHVSIANVWMLRHEKGLATAIKYVVFDDRDLEWVSQFEYKLRNERGAPLGGFHDVERCISIGTPPVGQDLPMKQEFTNLLLNEAILDRYRWLVEQVGARHIFRDFRVLLQLQVLAYGRKRGV